MILVGMMLGMIMLLKLKVVKGTGSVDGTNDDANA